MNKVQKEIYNLQLLDYKKKGKIRLCILKGRQLGVTTFKVLELLDTVLFYKNRTVFVVAHKKEKLKEIFEKVKFAYEKMPDLIDFSAVGEYCDFYTNKGFIWRKPKANFDNVNELFFKENNSKIRVTLDARSGTATDILITELAFVRDAENMMNGTLPAVEFGNVVIETTANGVGNYFYNIWNKQNEWTKAFFPWYEDPLYTESTDDELIIPKEIEHIKGLGLSSGQIAWYLRKYKENKMGTLQEYPSIPTDAFISSGSPVFDLTIVKQMEPCKFYEDAVFGELRIFHEPKEGEIYYIGVDCAEGVYGGDYTAIVVINDENRVYCSYRGHIIPGKAHEVLERIFTLGYTGNIIIERNNHGHTVLDNCDKCFLRPFLHKEQTIDKITNKKTKKYGFLTTEKSKNIIINRFVTTITNKDIYINDERIINELFTYVYDEKRKPNAISPNHDDLIIATALSLHSKETTYF